MAVAGLVRGHPSNDDKRYAPRVVATSPAACRSAHDPGELAIGHHRSPLILAGESDEIAEVAERAWRHFPLIPEGTPKVHLEVAGGDHYIIADTTRGTDLAMMGRYALAWLRLHVDGDERYREFLYGERPPEDAAKSSRYVVVP